MSEDKCQYRQFFVEDTPNTRISISWQNEDPIVNIIDQDGKMMENLECKKDGAMMLNSPFKQMAQTGGAALIGFFNFVSYVA